MQSSGGALLAACPDGGNAVYHIANGNIADIADTKITAFSAGNRNIYSGNLYKLFCRTGQKIHPERKRSVLGGAL